MSQCTYYTTNTMNQWTYFTTNKKKKPLDDYLEYLNSLQTTYTKGDFINMNNNTIKKIKEIKVVKSGKVVRVFFEDNTFVTTVCRDDDNFSLEFAVFLAYAKDQYAKEYTSEGVEFIAKILSMKKDYVKAVKKAISEYYKQIKAKRKEKMLKEEKHKKEMEKNERRKERARLKKEEQINIQKEAYVKAMKEINVSNDNDLFTKSIKNAMKEY